ncbi:MAG: site-specific integrase [Pseudomonadota bacterium]
MKSKLPKGVSSYRDRHGRRRFRFRGNGGTFQLGTEYGTESFWARLAAAQSGEKTRGVPSRVASDSLEAVAQSFVKSPRVQAWSTNTRKTYLGVLGELRREHGCRSMASLETRHIEAIMATKADRPTAANRIRKVFGMLCKHAMRMGIVAQNVAASAESYRNKGEGYHTWSEAEIARFLDFHRPGTVAHTAFTLMLFTGAARIDSVKLGWHNVVGDRFEYRRQKTRMQGGVLISIPIGGALATLLSSLPRDRLLFLQTAQGKARKESGLGNLMRAACDRAGLPNCSSHGLRKACARRFAEAGCTPHMIQAITGHKSLAEVERYTKAVVRADLADDAIGLLSVKKTRTKNG